ncbi:MAG: hypothetical protein A2Z30_00250 [Chloroflexi bacterium RBG_16_64_43]|nr:MAG: hypothetical protein A2Z30_00250 [Chloroflexi bacterium RBG_16_64_43]
MRDAHVEQAVVGQRLGRHPESAAQSPPVHHRDEQHRLGQAAPIHFDAHQWALVIEEDGSHHGDEEADKPAVARQLHHLDGGDGVEADPDAVAEEAPLGENAARHASNVDRPQKAGGERIARSAQVLGHANRMRKVVAAADAEDAEGRSRPA